MNERMKEVCRSLRTKRKRHQWWECHYHTKHIRFGGSRCRFIIKSNNKGWGNFWKLKWSLRSPSPVSFLLSPLQSESGETRDETGYINLWSRRAWFHLFICSFVHLFVYSFIRLFVCSFVRLFVSSFLKIEAKITWLGASFWAVYGNNWYAIWNIDKVSLKPRRLLDNKYSTTFNVKHPN